MTRAKFGSIKRKYKREHSRKQRKNNISSEVNAFIAAHIPELQNKEIDENNYQLQLEKLLKILQKHYPKLDDYRIARNCLSSKINEGNKEGKYCLPVPPYIIQAKRGAIFRTSGWFIKVKALNQWKYHWQRQLASSKTENIASTEYLLTSSLISAALYGGLCIPEALVALANQLIEINEPLIKNKNEVWFDLTFRSKSQDTNVKIDNSESLVTLRRWYPDAVSLAWFRQFLYFRQKNTKILKKLDQKKCWYLINQYMQHISPITAFKSFSTFCFAATGELESQHSVELPNAILEYANGRLPSSSLTTKQQENLLNLQFDKVNKEENKIEDNNLKLKQFELVSQKIIKFVQYKNIVSFNYEYTFELIRHSLLTHFENGEKSTPEVALNSLKAIELSSLPISISFLINWLIYLLEERKIAVSSAKTYFSKIGTLWATYMADLDLRLLDEESFEELYLLMLNVAHTEQSRRDKASLLNDLHQYGVNKLNLPVLTNDLLSAKTIKQKFVKVGFISEPMFRSLCKEISMISDADKLTVKGLICFVIIAYRLGLRRGELLKLQLRDIENSLEQWLYIRENKFGNNKTSSALRKLPITALLTKEENTLFTSYLNERKSTVSNSPTSLVFSKSLTPTLPFDGNSISNLVSSILKNMTNTALSFHHLRHSALSRLHLIIEGMDSLIERYTSYSKEQAQLIRTLLLTKNNEQVHRDNYWALAGIAGHATPETTFANYLHFVDRVLFERLSKSNIHFSITEIKNISAISSNYLTRHCKKEQISPESIPIYSLYQKMVKDISPFSREITLTKNDNSQLSAQEGEIYDQKQTLTPLLCMKVLKEAEQGESISTLVYKYQINEQIIEKWITNAKALANKKTQQGKLRLFLDYSKSSASTERLCPQKPPSKVELDDADIALVKLRSLYHDNKSVILWCVNYFINHTTRSSTAICFTKKAEFEKFIGFLIQVFPKKRWTIALLLTENTANLLAKWRQVSQDIPIFVNMEKKLKNKKRFPEGKISLYLNHLDKNNIIEQKTSKIKGAKKYSTPTLRYIFHILAIML